ncbi:MAG: ECF transporter S component [Anaerolineales bacterium]
MNNDSRLWQVLGALLGVVVFFAAIILIGGSMNESLQIQEAAGLRFLFVGIGLLIVFAIYWFTRDSDIWQVGTREVVYMAIGAALYAVFSYLFNGTVFVVPSVSQVSLRPAIAIPMFFGYVFGPVVGFFSGAVGNMFGDALTGFGLSPQWSVGNGLIGLIAGMAGLYDNKRRGLNTVLIVSAVLAGIATLLYLLNPNMDNMLFFAPDEGIFGDAAMSTFAGLSAVIGLILVVVVRFAFDDPDIQAAVTWSMLGNFIGIGFAAISDIWINGFSPEVAIVGEFIPAAGPNMIFAAILVPILVRAWDALQRQTGR